MFSTILVALLGCSNKTNDAAGYAAIYDTEPIVAPTEDVIYRGEVRYYLGESASDLERFAPRVEEMWNEIGAGVVTFHRVSDAASANLVIECAGGPPRGYSINAQGQMIGVLPFEFTNQDEYLYEGTDRQVEVGITPTYCKYGDAAVPSLFYIFGHVVGVPNAQQTGTAIAGTVMSNIFAPPESGVPHDWEITGLGLIFDGIRNGSLRDNSTQRTHERSLRRGA
jgi:hypothetical protein